MLVLLMRKVADTLALIFKWPRRGRELLPATVPAGIGAFKRESVVIDHHVIESHGLCSSELKGVGYDLNSSDWITAKGRQNGRPGLVKCASDLSRIDQASWRHQITGVQPDIQRAPCVVGWRTQVDRNISATRGVVTFT
jgi:hypothetical protein